MKVRVSVKKICSECKVIKRHGVVAVGKDIREACLRVLAIERAAMVLQGT